MIVCKNIFLSFSEKSLFENLNLEIKRGENVCLNAPSGHGKTTILNMLQGYVLPDKGQVIINNKKLSSTTVHETRKNIGFIPQNINLPVKNGAELMSLMQTQTMQQEVKHYLNKLQLDESILLKNFDEISGGQKQRLIISICLSLNKSILLMDEPTSSLDDNSIKILIDTVKKLNNKTIVSASHNKLWADSTDRVFRL
jgi:polar amino acid transport system ATP-binding protein/putative ABC transport system ATP-binding protein